MSCFWCVKLSFLEKRNSTDCWKKRSYLQKYTINFDETKSLLLLKECSLNIFIWILKFRIANSQEYKHLQTCSNFSALSEIIVNYLQGAIADFVFNTRYKLKCIQVLHDTEDEIANGCKKIGHGQKYLEA